MTPWILSYEIAQTLFAMSVLLPGISDHDIVLFTLKSSCHKKRHVKRKVYIRKRSDDERIKLELKTLAAKLNTQYDNNTVDAKRIILKTVFATQWTLASRIRLQVRDTTYLGSIARFDDNPG